MKYYEVDFNICTNGCVRLEDARDLTAALAGETGFETFEDTDTGVRGYVQTALFDEEALKEIIGCFPMEGVTITYIVRKAEDKDWNEQWENEGFEPIIIDRRCVIHDGRHLPDDDAYPVSVEIDAHLAFGTGTHETTRMMVAALLDLELEGKNVLDCGCGTGILGIVALKHGAGSVTGYDIDEWSVDNSRHNAIINNVDSRHESLHGDSSVLGYIEKRFDVVTANINRNILLNDMPRFCNAMVEGGILLLSGFYREDVATLTEKALGLGLSLASSTSDNDWACIKLIKV